MRFDGLEGADRDLYELGVAAYHTLAYVRKRRIDEFGKAFTGTNKSIGLESHGETYALFAAFRAMCIGSIRRMLNRVYQTWNQLALLLPCEGGRCT